VDFVVELLHAGDNTVFFEQNPIHVGLRVVVVSHVPVVDHFVKDLLLLFRLSLLGEVVHVDGLGDDEVGVRCFAF
jgi:hypothetical protein